MLEAFYSIFQSLTKKQKLTILAFIGGEILRLEIDTDNPYSCPVLKAVEELAQKDTQHECSVFFDALDSNIQSEIELIYQSLQNPSQLFQHQIVPEKAARDLMRKQILSCVKHRRKHPIEQSTLTDEGRTQQQHLNTLRIASSANQQAAREDEVNNLMQWAHTSEGQNYFFGTDPNVAMQFFSIEGSDAAFRQGLNIRVNYSRFLLNMLAPGSQGLVYSLPHHIRNNPYFPLINGLILTCSLLSNIGSTGLAFSNVTGILKDLGFSANTVFSIAALITIFGVIAKAGFEPTSYEVATEDIQQVERNQDENADIQRLWSSVRYLQSWLPGVRRLAVEGGRPDSSQSNDEASEDEILALN